MRLIDADALKQLRWDYINGKIKVLDEDDMIDCCPTIDPVKQEWVSVHDRLPDKDTLVLCVGAKGGMFLGYIRYLYGDDKTAYVRVPNARSGRYAAFWMPLPEAPRMDGE